MKLNPEQRKLYDAFYESAHGDGVLDAKTESLVGLAAAMAMNCEPCTIYYVNRCEESGATAEETSAVLAKVMAVAAGQKRLQAEEILKKRGN